MNANVITPSTVSFSNDSIAIKDHKNEKNILFYYWDNINSQWIQLKSSEDSSAGSKKSVDLVDASQGRNQEIVSLALDQQGASRHVAYIDKNNDVYLKVSSVLIADFLISNFFYFQAFLFMFYFHNFVIVDIEHDECEFSVFLCCYRELTLCILHSSKCFSNALLQRSSSDLLKVFRCYFRRCRSTRRVERHPSRAAPSRRPTSKR